MKSVITFIRQQRPHDFFENSIKLGPLTKGTPAVLQFRYEVGVSLIEDPLQFIHYLPQKDR